MDADSIPARARLEITGRVQNVYYRASTVYEAQNLRLTGWVRNCSGGSVEVVAEGPRRAVEALIEWCRRGPPGARVDQVAVEWQPATREFAAFEIRR